MCPISLPSLAPTGQQGGSVINYVLNDPELSQKYKICAITRDGNSEKAKQLEEKTKVTPFDAKAKFEQHIRGLHIKSAFYSPEHLIENFQSQTFLAPQQAPGATGVMARHNSPKTKLPFVDATGDTGKFVGGILVEPDRYESNRFCAAAPLYSWKEVTAIMSKERPRR